LNTADIIVGPITLYSDNYNGKPTLGPLSTTQVFSSNSSGNTTNAPWSPTKASLSTTKLALSITSPILVLILIFMSSSFDWKFHRRARIAIAAKLKNRSAGDLALSSSIDDESASQTTIKSLKSEERKRAILNILFAAFMAIIPVLALALTLLIILFKYQIKSSDADVISKATVDDADAYFLKFDTTRYATVADWASSIAMLLPGFLMTLMWYHVAYEIQKLSMSDEKGELPTPYQTSVLISLKSGSFLTLLEFLLYTVSWLRAKQSPILARTGRILILASVLGYVYLSLFY
jgi:hypothetical protein